MEEKYNNARLWQIGLFSLNNAATNLYLAMMAYVSYYANSIAGFAAILITMLVTAMSVFDGITDPVAGFLLDRMNGRFGKFRPFMFMGNLMMAGSCLLLFLTTHHIPEVVRLPYFIFIYAVFVIGYTFQTVVGKSGQTVITDNPVQRPVCTYFDSLYIMASYGGVALLVSAYLVPKYDGFTNFMVYFQLVWFVVTLSFVCTLLAMLGIWEKDRKEFFVGDAVYEKVKLKQYVDIMRNNRPLRNLIFANSVDRFAATVYSHTAVGVMLFGVMMNNYVLAGLIGIITAIPTLVVVTGGIRVAQKWGQKRALVIFTELAIFFQVLMAFVLLRPDVNQIRYGLYLPNTVSILFFVVFVLLNGCKSVTNNMVVPMIADCSDYEVTRSGHYVPGIMGALFSFVDKAFAALGTAFVGLVLLIVGFGGTFPQVSDPLTPTLKWTILFLYCGVPILGWLVSLLALHRYELDKKAMHKVQIEKSYISMQRRAERLERKRERKLVREGYLESKKERKQTKKMK
ncbi:MAG: MFS transporter [Lachnospiraceae bacterium]|nr:MFS transporter [Lachnospiraceae bacterium]